MITNVLGLQTTQDQKCLRVTNFSDLQTSQGYKVQGYKRLTVIKLSWLLKWPIFMQASKFGIGKNTEHLFLLLPLWVKTGHLKMSVDFKISFSCLQLSPKNQQNSFFRISALASKKMSNQKIRAHYITNWRILF